MRKTALFWRRFLFDDVGDVLWGGFAPPCDRKKFTIFVKSAIKLG